MTNKKTPINEFTIGTLYDQLYGLFVDPRSLWSKIKQDAFEKVIEKHVFEVITSEEQRLQIVTSFLDSRALNKSSNAFSEIQSFSLKINAKEPLYVSDLHKIIPLLEVIIDTNIKYLGVNGRYYAVKLLNICEWLSQQVETKNP
jgi:uncharacterized protein (DUF2225 family)